MNVVLYTDDFEAITILDLPLWLLEQMEKVGFVRVAVQEPVTQTQLDNLPDPSNLAQLNVVTIRCEKLRWKDGSTKTILVTPDEELALMLRPEWLPGQRASVYSMKQTIQSLTQQLVRALRK